LLNSTNQAEKAIECYDMLLAIEPDNISALLEKNTLRRTYYGMGAYDDDIHNNQDSPDCYFNKGLALTVLEYYAQAYDCFDQAIDLYKLSDGKSKKMLCLAYLFRGQWFAALKDFDEALIDYDQALEIDPYSLNAYLRKVELYTAKDDEEGAAETFRTATKMGFQEDQLVQLFKTAVNFFQSRKLWNDTLIEFYDTLLEYNPKDYITHYEKGSALFNMERFYGALDSLEESLRIAPSEEATAKKGLTLKALENFHEAIQWLEKVKKPEIDIIEACVDCYIVLGFQSYLF